MRPQFLLSRFVKLKMSRITESLLLMLPVFNDMVSKNLSLTYLLDGKLVTGYLVLFVFTGIVSGPPSVSSINRVNNPTNNLTSLSYTVTFDKSVSGVDVTDFTLTSTGTSAATIISVLGSGAVYTVTLNSVSGDGTIRLDLNNSGTAIADLEGRYILSGFNSGEVYTIDNIPPTVAITSNKMALKAGETATLTFTFSEAVTGFIASDVVVTNGTLGTLTGSASPYTISFTPTVNFEGTASVSLASTTFEDLAGNANTDGADSDNTISLTLDTKVPTIVSVTPSFGANLNSVEDNTNQTVEVTTTNIEDGQIVGLH